MTALSPDISVIIVNYNGKSHLEQCLNSLYDSKDDLDFEIWVVDNGSTDGSLVLLHEKFPEVRRIENAENLGFATANNQAIREASGRYTLLLNNDTIVLPNALHIMLRVMESHRKFAAVGPQLLNEDGSLQPSCMHFPSLWRGIVNYLKVLAGGSAKFIASHVGETITVDAVTGACMLIRREAIRQVGLLDEGFFMYAEETDWSYRAQALGWEIAYVPEAKIIHLGGQSADREPNRFYVEKRYGRVRFYRKHYGRFPARIASALIRINILLRWLYHSDQRQNYLAILRAYDARVAKLFPSKAFWDRQGDSVQ